MTKWLWLLAGVLLLNKQQKLRAELELHIQQLHPLVQNKFRALIAEFEQRGYKVEIISSYRSFAKQASLYAAGQTPAPAGSSYHNFGMAIDINVTKDGTRYNMQSGRAAWLETGLPAEAEARGFDWGGRFGGYYSARGDSVHFQYTMGYSTQALRQKAYLQFGTNNIQGNRLNL